MESLARRALSCSVRRRFNSLNQRCFGPIGISTEPPDKWTVTVMGAASSRQISLSDRNPRRLRDCNRLSISGGGDSDGLNLEFLPERRGASPQKVGLKILAGDKVLPTEADEGQPPSAHFVPDEVRRTAKFRCCLSNGEFIDRRALFSTRQFRFNRWHRVLKMYI